MIVEKPARALRQVMLRTARSPLRPLWALLYAVIARGVALIVAPPRTGTSVYLAGSVASGEPVYGVSDIDLVAVAPDESEAVRVRRRFEALCRALPPVRELMPDFCTYDADGLTTVLGAPYPVTGLGDGRAVFLGADAVRDENGLLDRPGLYGTPQWRRLRGSPGVVRPPRPQDPFLPAWLELQYRWRWALFASRNDGGMHRPALGLVVEAARIWLWLAHGERHRGRRAPLERALALMDEEREGLLHALEIYRTLHRAPPVAVEKLLACFVGLSDAIAGLVDEGTAAAGVTHVELLGADVGDPGVDDVPLLDWRALVLPMVDWSPGRPAQVVEERLVPVADDPTDPARLMAVAARDAPGRVPVLRHGSLLIEPTLDVWGRGRLRTLQCGASDPVSAALLDGRAHAVFPEVPGWSAHDWARRAVSEHRAWLFEGRNDAPRRHQWLGGRPAAVFSGPATLGVLLSAARSALFLESVEEGSPQLPLTFAATAAALATRDPGVGADAAEACAVLEECRHEQRPPPPELVGHFRRQVESLFAYAPVETGRVARIAPAPRPTVDGQRFRIRRGTNISHWLSQTWWMTNEERLRGFTREDALRIRELGLDHVRIPVDEHFLRHADGRRDRPGLDLVARTLEWCQDAELSAILSLHALRPGVGHAPPARREPRGAGDIADLWRDLSDALAGSPLDTVAYELLGEPTAPRDEQWNQVAAASVAAIREREPERTIVLGSNRRNGYAALPSLAVPDDPHLILGFHYYEPMPLTHYRASWIPSLAAYTGPIRYPGTPIPPAELARLEPTPRERLGQTNQHYDRERIRADFAIPASVSQRTGRDLYCGEFGVLGTVPDELRLRWYRDVIDALEEYEIAWSTWDLKGAFGLYDGDSPTIVHRAIAERRFAA